MKKLYLLDTNVISEMTKRIPNSSIIKKMDENDGLCAICSTVWQESIYGLNLLPDGKRKEMISDMIDAIKESYEIIPYDSFASQICGEIRAKCQKSGNPVPRFDSQIAATAIANNMILVTHNTKDFEVIAENSMLQIEDWWN